jgi:hypothetical protein
MKNVENLSTFLDLTEALRCYNCISPMANDCRDVNQMSSTVS